MYLKVKKSFKEYAAAGLVASAATLGMSSAALADTVDYTDNGISTTLSLYEGGVTVTGSNDIQVFSGSGLGIVGGINSAMIDSGETMSFSFDNPADNVVIPAFQAGDADGDGFIDLNATFEAFDENGSSLGTIMTDFDENTPVDVSAMFFGSSISGFDITMNNDMVRISQLSFTEAASGVASFSCTGFGAPFDDALSIKKKSKKTIPVKMQLGDENGYNVSDMDVNAAPVINVAFNGVTYGNGSTDDAGLEAPGHSNDGNQFRYSVDDQAWIFNLGTKQFSSPGEYSVSVHSGDESEYTVSAASGQCAQTFTRQPQ